MLEKKIFHENAKYPNQAGRPKPQISEEDSLCAICNFSPKTPEGDDTDIIIYCELCGIGVH